jgi:hypothetical protein
MKPTRILAIVIPVLLGIGVVYATDVFFTPDSTSIQVVGTNVVFSTSFLTTPGRVYQIQLQYNDLNDTTNSNSWINVTNSILGVGGTVTWNYTDIGAATLSQRFYRLRVELTL